jgi:hypothetical protein
MRRRRCRSVRQCRGPGEPCSWAPSHEMNNNTRAALLALAEALAADPAGCRELNVYGHLPDHLADAVGDLDHTDNPPD